ncbi:HD family phosphohydrolase [Aquibacillus sp. 3ASR75-11]|uniref:HD family phosphohydrolase n=1 Tax=Terrihalobacillus insolitus TaxID=2950438 RepID=A0A9X3WT06_9BACI|nr:HD family phosphohydrolase [Terrihalobacillus insolitus]MDC3413352.1 HD family phosphohydrolase [Terrihalobacillus insolitus]MDC3424935.1 HD family phosphohydrolase [Terrihalobacillus insolitus]
MKNRWKWLRSFRLKQMKWLNIWMPLLIMGLFFFVIAISNVYTETYDIERFSEANQTIRSPLTIENKDETERKSREAVEAVEDRFSISSEVTQERVGYVEELFAAITKLEEQESQDEGKEEDSEPPTSTEKVQNLQQILNAEITKNLDQTSLLRLVEASSNERSLGKELLTTSLYEAFNAGVRTEDVESTKEDLAQQLRYSSLNNKLKNVLINVSNFAVVENATFDVEKTVEARRQALSNVEPVMIRAGEVIVREGQTITNEIYEDLALVGLLNNDRNMYPVIGLFILVVLLIGIIGYEMYCLHLKGQLDRGKVASIVLVGLLLVSFMKVVSYFSTPTSQYFIFVPVATGGMLFKILLNERTAITLSGVYAILGSLIFNSAIPGSLNMEAGIYFFLSQLAGIIFLINVKDRSAILKAGIGITAVNILVVLLFQFLSFEKYSLTDILIQTSYGVLAAFLSAVLAIGLLPFFEATLGILSDSKLLTLSSPNHPLLRKILIEAPGTYHHSVMVANLSEASCEAIGANGLLARVASYYHDLGKTVRPHYFIENQMAIKNPHDFIEPIQSAEIIINHPYDGANLLKKHHIPKEIIDIAEQHHGTTLLKYFYYKEKEHNKQINEALYRYPGPKPQTKEAAIVCICDSVEAAVRSLKEPTKNKIEEIVTNIMNDRLMDGQLNESPLTLKEIELIHKAICETLNGIFHTRIQYPSKKNIREAN